MMNNAVLQGLIRIISILRIEQLKLVNPTMQSILGPLYIALLAVENGR